MEDRKPRPDESWTSYIDAEDRPRNEAAIRTALMLGAEFQQGVDAFGNEIWSIKGIAYIGKKTMCAWMFLIPFGVGITQDARACLFKDIPKENSK